MLQSKHVYQYEKTQGYVHLVERSRLMGDSFY